MDVAFDEQHRRKKAEVLAEFCELEDRHYPVCCHVRELSKDPCEHLPVGHFPGKELAYALAVGDAVQRRDPTDYRHELLRGQTIVAACPKAVLVTASVTTAASTVGPPPSHLCFALSFENPM